MNNTVGGAMQPRPDSFEGVVRLLFENAGVASEIARDISPSLLARQNYNYLNVAFLEQLQRIFEPGIHTVAHFLLPADGTSLPDSPPMALTREGSFIQLFRLTNLGAVVPSKGAF